MTRLLLIATVAVSAVSLAACDRDAFRAKRDAEWTAKHTPKVIAKLDCPEHEGQLTLVKAAPDGLSCDYKGEDSEVTLKLLSLGAGGANAALDPLEAELRGLMPTKPGVSASATSGPGGAKSDVDIDLPGVKIKAGDNGAKISVAGSTVINADDNGAEIKVRDGDADGDAEVGVKADDKDVSIKTGPRKWKHRQKAGITSLFILAGDGGPYTKVGYTARGPKEGPLAVAIVKAKGDKEEGDVFDDAKDLVKHNVGG